MRSNVRNMKISMALVTVHAHQLGKVPEYGSAGDEGHNGPRHGRLVRARQDDCGPAGYAAICLLESTGVEQQRGIISLGLDIGQSILP